MQFLHLEFVLKLVPWLLLKKQQNVTYKLMVFIKNKLVNNVFQIPKLELSQHLLIQE
jgi:hypothetical protein